MHLDSMLHRQIYVRNELQEKYAVSSLLKRMLFLQKSRITAVGVIGAQCGPFFSHC